MELTQKSLHQFIIGHIQTLGMEGRGQDHNCIPNRVCILGIRAFIKMLG